jgi:carbon monoxide dehydrogenase subunit G
MNIHDEFRVSVPVEEAWRVLLVVERIAPCMPGAQLQEVEGDEYRGIVKVKVGPITAQYKGAAKIIEADETARRIVLKGEGRDTRGQGNASATVTAQLEPDGDGTNVTIDTDLNVTGKVAQFGRGVMADVSSKLLGQFATCLESRVLAGEGPGTPTPSLPPSPASASAPASASPASQGSAGPESSAPESSEVSSPRAEGGVRKIDAPEAEAVDLMKAAGGAVAKRLVPVLLAGAVVIGLVIWLVSK